MAVLDTSIMGGDEQWDIRSYIIDICKIDYKEYLDDKSLLTRDIFEKHFDNIVFFIEERHSHIAYHVFGYFILITGSHCPEFIRQRIIKLTDWKYESGKWSAKYVKDRKRHLRDLREKITNHKPGVVSYLKE